jgi:DNA-binding response OmpR family regulator
MAMDTQTTPSEPKRRTVVVVEDDLDFAVFLHRFLEDHGFQAVVVPDGLQAQEVLEKETPDLITLDLIMPHETGIKFYRELRAQERWKAIPVIVITGLDAASDHILTYRKFLHGKNLAEPDAYLTKPVEPDRLLGVIYDVLVARDRAKRPGTHWFVDLDIAEEEEIWPEKTPPNAVSVFEALGSPLRLRMLELMASHREICVYELVQILDTSQSGVSSHLTVLRQAGVVKTRKVGKWVYYSVHLEALRRAFAATEEVLRELLELSTHEDPEARVQEKIERGLLWPLSASHS